MGLRPGQTNSTSFKKGDQNWLGKKHSEESKKKMSETRKQRILNGKIKVWNKGTHIFLPCSFKKGIEHPNWKGGRKNHQGYIEVYSPNHPYHSKRYVAEHRLVMEQKLGRHILPHEIVHHLDFDKTNNHPDNLHLFETNQAHTDYHGLLRCFVRQELRGEL